MATRLTLNQKIARSIRATAINEHADLKARLADANRGAQVNALVNESLAKKLKLAVEALAVSGENFRALLRCPDWSCSECAALVETYTEDIDKALKQIGEQQK